MGYVHDTVNILKKIFVQNNGTCFITAYRHETFIDLK